MQLINYFAASILSYLGLLAGIVLVKIAPEEQKPLRKYFAWMRKSIILLIFLFVLFYYYKKLNYFIALILIFAVLLVFEAKSKTLRLKSAASYAAFGIIFFLSSSNLNLFVIQASMIFLNGLPTASLIFNKKEKNADKIMLYNSVFFVAANLSFFYHLSFLIFE